MNANFTSADNPAACSAEPIGESARSMSADSTIAALPARLEALTEEVALLRGLVSNGIPGQGNEAVLRELHSQLQEARAGTHWKILRPVLIDLVRLLDDLGQREAQERCNPQPAAAILREVTQDVLDVLDRQGFQPYWSAGDCPDARKHQIVATKPTSIAELVGKIADRLLPGYACEDRVLRPEKVIVYARAEVDADVQPSEGHP